MAPSIKGMSTQLVAGKDRDGVRVKNGMFLMPKSPIIRNVKSFSNMNNTDLGSEEMEQIKGNRLQ